jgi:3-deoxy-D-manno-octulosonic-acid transferase
MALNFHKTRTASKLNKQHLDLAIKAYSRVWRLMLPALGINKRLKDGFSHRMLSSALPAADLWIQAASAGEAYLAWSLVENLKLPYPCRILATTNTRQGMEILEKAKEKLSKDDGKHTLMCKWFPFDQPEIMDMAVKQISPDLVVLLETEIWPGLLNALAKNSRPAWIINGRMTRKSFSRYWYIKNFLHLLRPEGVLAISKPDADRFAALFGKDIVKQMPNIKFDRLQTGKDLKKQNPLDSIIPRESKFLVMGSIRQQEETAALKMIRHVINMHPQVITGLFPRHMHRTEAWQAHLAQSGLPWTLRSRIENHAKPGQVILWDTFGELSDAYKSAHAVFVGGSIEPLGGQNFLEPLACGIRPVTGPYWDNFFWVGEDIFNQKLVFRESTWLNAAKRLADQLYNPENPAEVMDLASQYICARQGGTRQACIVIESCLKKAWKQRSKYE